VASHSADGVIELMPIADASRFAFKYVNGHPSNTRHGLPTVMAFGVLADVATGAPRCCRELTLTTAHAHRGDVGRWPPGHAGAARQPQRWR
jgi:ornithine cyclodeaminase